MRILIDIVHPADVNFYKNAVKKLRKEHKLVITVMKRGTLPKLVEQEIEKVIIIGQHAKAIFFKKSIYNIKRVLALRSFIKKIRADVVTSFSYYSAAATFGMKIPSVIFHDDPEYKMQFFLCKMFADKLVIPNLLNIEAKNIKKYYSYKEWAYLNPKYFTPKSEVLKKYNLEKNEYIFIREIAPISLNYNLRNRLNYSKIIKFLSYKKIKVVVSIEDKSRKEEFKDCIILEEPVENFYSLVYHALALFSSGDTMVREAALLGVPAFYTGKRQMEVNKELIENGFITQISNEKELLNELKHLSKKIKQKMAKKVSLYTKNLNDTTKVIIDEILFVKNETRYLDNC